MFSLLTDVFRIGRELGVDPTVILQSSHGRRSIDTIQLYDPSKANWECECCTFIPCLHYLRIDLRRANESLDVSHVEGLVGHWTYDVNLSNKGGTLSHNCFTLQIPKQFGPDAVEVPGARGVWVISIFIPSSQRSLANPGYMKNCSHRSRQPRHHGQS